MTPRRPHEVDHVCRDIGADPDPPDLVDDRRQTITGDDRAERIQRFRGVGVPARDGQLVLGIRVA